MNPFTLVGPMMKSLVSLTALRPANSAMVSRGLIAGQIRRTKSKTLPAPASIPTTRTTLPRSRSLRWAQSGLVRSYVFVFVVGVAVICAVVILASQL